MREFTFIFKLTFVILFLFFIPICTFAADPGLNTNPNDEEIVTGPYSGYGEFGSGDDQIEDERFFQYGRFFGVGIGLGATSASGNAGRIYQGGFPTLDFRLQYWFDFNFALTLGLQNSKHSYDIEPDGLTSVNHFRTIAQVVYYLDTHNMSAPLTFIGPHFMVGGGLYRRTDNIGSGNATSNTTPTIQEESVMGFNAGLGIELTLKPKRTYLQFETLMHFVNYNDMYDPKFASEGIPDKTGYWYSFSAVLLFTW